MFSKISKTLRQWVSTLLIFMGLAVVVLGASIVKLGAWIGDRQVVAMEDDQDITSEELAQVIKEAREARRDED